VLDGPGGLGSTSTYRLVSTGAVETVTAGRLRRVPAEYLAKYLVRLRFDARSATPAAVMMAREKPTRMPRGASGIYLEAMDTGMAA
jgi:hypothetical protein